MATDPTFGDKILQDAIMRLSGGVDIDVASGTVAEALQAMQKQAKALNAVDYTSQEKRVKCPACQEVFVIQTPIDFDKLAKTMAQTAKMIDETARLTQFMNGKPDSRPDLPGLAGMDVLKALTNEQLAQVESWIAQNALTASE